MTPPNIEQMTRRITEEIWNKGDIDAVDELFADDFTLHIPGGMTFDGKEGFKQYLGMYKEAFPDLNLEQTRLFADENGVATEWRFRGTHNGPLMGIEATGNEVDVSGMTSIRIDNGKVVEQTLYWDRLEQLEQLGLGAEEMQKPKST